MAKRSHSKKTKKSLSNSWSKTVRHYFRTVFLSFFVGGLVFVWGKYFFIPATPCANSLSCESDLVEKIENGAVGVFQGNNVKVPEINLAFDITNPSVLGTTEPDGEKHIYVDLASQKLYAYQGDTKILETFISSGRWNRTPVGNFHVWTKLRSTRMSGGSGTDYYNLPNVPYVMYFYHDFGLHGAYWHNNFGHTMSHGCVNMRPIDAGAIFDWVDGPKNGEKGTIVSICNRFTEPNICEQNNPINS